MKVALPCRDNQVDGHFGHCEYFTIFTLGEMGAIIEENKLIPPPSCDGFKAHNLSGSFKTLKSWELLF